MACGLTPALWPLEDSKFPQPSLAVGLKLFRDARNEKLAAEALPPTVLLPLPPDHLLLACGWLRNPCGAAPAIARSSIRVSVAVWQPGLNVLAAHAEQDAELVIAHLDRAVLVEPLSHGGL